LRSSGGVERLTRRARFWIRSISDLPDGAGGGGDRRSGGGIYVDYDELERDVTRTLGAAIS
jgi:hypothetical protein